MIERFSLFFAGLGAGVSIALLLQPAPQQMKCKGVVYHMADGSAPICEPRLECPRGPRRG